MGNTVISGAEPHVMSPTQGQQRNSDAIQQHPDTSTFSYNILFIHIFLIDYQNRVFICNPGYPGMLYINKLAANSQRSAGLASQYWD